MWVGVGVWVCVCVCVWGRMIERKRVEDKCVREKRGTEIEERRREIEREKRYGIVRK